MPALDFHLSNYIVLYGRTVRGPKQALKELWTEQEAPETDNTYQYVLDLTEKLEETCKIARDSLRDGQQVYKHHYDKRPRSRSLKVGDKVLVLLNLLPTNNTSMEGSI